MTSAAARSPSSGLFLVIDTYSGSVHVVDEIAYEVIGQNIENVKTAYKAVEENMKAFKEADESANNIASETKQKLEDARKKVQSLFQS